MCLKLIRELAASDKQRSHSHIAPDCRVHIASRNSFPTAAGLASSASGYACLVFTLAQVYGLTASTEQLSAIARQGSGSACRSLYGGFVAWERGVQDDGSDSVAVQVADEKHWDDIHIVVFVVSAERKHVASTTGMQTTVKTSPLHSFRADSVVPGRMDAMKAAIAARDFAAFADLTMRDSNQFHATCLDTFPPIFYMNDTSRALVQLTHQLNAHAGKTVAAYTFDAGPNAVVYVQGRQNAHDLIDAALNLFPPTPASLDQAGGYLVDHFAASGSVSTDEIASRASAAATRLAPLLTSCDALRRGGALGRVIHTVPGGGPRVAPASSSLLPPA